MSLQNKVVVITGGAGGIGRVASSRFADNGAQVVILDYNQDAGNLAQQEIAAQGGQVLFIPTDISDENSVKEAFAQIADAYGRVDVLYNNASVFLGGKDSSIDEVDSAVWHRVLAINLDGLYYCSKYAVPLMKEKGGSIINTASSAGVVGIPQCSAYTATKGATVALTKTMAVDLGKYNIRVNCIAPAAIMTDMVKESNLNDPEFDNEFFLKQITPLRRWGKSEDIAALACFLAEDAASYLNGVIIPADGGITINGNVNRVKD